MILFVRRSDYLLKDHSHRPSLHSLLFVVIRLSDLCHPNRHQNRQQSRFSYRKMSSCVHALPYLSKVLPFPVPVPELAGCASSKQFRLSGSELLRESDQPVAVSDSHPHRRSGILFHWHPNPPNPRSHPARRVCHCS